MKDHWTQIIDAAEREALMLHGKWREDKPTFVRRADGLWVLVNEQFIAWRANSGKMSCRNEK